MKFDDKYKLIMEAAENGELANEDLSVSQVLNRTKKNINVLGKGNRTIFKKVASNIRHPWDSLKNLAKTGKFTSNQNIQAATKEKNEHVKAIFKSFKDKGWKFIENDTIKEIPDKLSSDLLKAQKYEWISSNKEFKFRYNMDTRALTLIKRNKVKGEDGKEKIKGVIVATTGKTDDTDVKMDYEADIFEDDPNDFITVINKLCAKGGCPRLETDAEGDRARAAGRKDEDSTEEDEDEKDAEKEE